MTYPAPGGSPAPQPPHTSGPATPPPYTGTAPDLGLPVPGSLHAAAWDLRVSVEHQLGVPSGDLPTSGSPLPGWPQQPGRAPRLVSAGGRLAAFLLELVLVMFTAGIGWLAWALVTFRNGQTPARQILGQVAADAHTGQPLDWSRTALRELVFKGVVGYFATVVSGGIYFFVDSLMVFGSGRQTLHDRMANSIVVRR
ncbi:RDD family protein [Actinoplanes sp. NPDC023936]|uniref:RDD family protein n=1 Tax=Actinoplanes sp. NPDC023936 TaxID=3154910 RepID=UPI00340C991B